MWIVSCDLFLIKILLKSYTCRKSTFTAKKTKLKTQTQNVNHPNPNATLVKEI